MDRDHVVIGQLMDAQSMSLLARLGALPARNNIGNAGSPIVRFLVYDAGVLPDEQPAAPGAAPLVEAHGLVDGPQARREDGHERRERVRGQARALLVNLLTPRFPEIP